MRLLKIYTHIHIYTHDTSRLHCRSRFVLPAQARATRAIDRSIGESRNKRLRVNWHLHLSPCLLYTRMYSVCAYYHAHEASTRICLRTRRSGARKSSGKTAEEFLSFALSLYLLLPLSLPGKWRNAKWITRDLHRAHSARFFTRRLSNFVQDTRSRSGFCVRAELASILFNFRAVQSFSGFSVKRSPETFARHDSRLGAQN